MREKHKRLAIFYILVLILMVVVGCTVYQDIREKRQMPGKKQGIVQFANATAQPGKTVDVVALNYPMFRALTYEWKIDGELIENTGSSYVPVEADLEKMITVTVRADGYKDQMLSVYCSNLPVLYIDMDDGMEVTSKENYKSGYYVFQGAGESLYDNHEGGILIKGRGNYSWWEGPKHPYKVKLDSGKNLLGMGKSRHWILIPNFVDASLMRNTLAYRAAGEIGLVSMKTQWVSLVLNGSYAGNYQLCQYIQPGEDCVPVTDLKDTAHQVVEEFLLKGVISADQEEALEDYLEVELGWMSTGEFSFGGQKYRIPDSIEVPPPTGGFILEIDENLDEPSYFITRMEQPVMFHSPAYAWKNVMLMDYVREYIQTIEDAVYAEDYHVIYHGASVHYSDLIDMDSLAKYWLITEFFYNMDIGKKSVFLYKDVEGKAFMGPIWDMDLSSGGEEGVDVYNQWATLTFHDGAQNSMWYRQLIKDPDFIRRVYQLYHQYRFIFQNIVEDGGAIDQYYGYLYESGQADARLWREDGTYFERAVYQELKPWCTNRLAWLDEQFASEETLAQSLNP